MKRFAFAAALAAALGSASAGGARAEDLASYPVTLKNHRFTPTEIHVPSGKPFFIIVTNQDDTADEFEMISAGGREGDPGRRPGQGADTAAWPRPLPVLRRFPPGHRAGRDRLAVGSARLMRATPHRRGWFACHSRNRRRRPKHCPTRRAATSERSAARKPFAGRRAPSSAAISLSSTWLVSPSLHSRNRSPA